MRAAIDRKRLQRWEAVVGVCCFIAGILAPVLGMFLLTIEWFAGVPLNPWFHAVGTTLLIIGIPLILFAGFCLDWSEAKPKEPSNDHPRDNNGGGKVIQLATIAVLYGAATLGTGQPTRSDLVPTGVVNKGENHGERDASVKDANVPRSWRA